MRRPLKRARERCMEARRLVAEGIHPSADPKAAVQDTFESLVRKYFDLMRNGMAGRSPTDKIRVLRLPEVCEITGLCRSSIYQMEAEQRFLRRIKIGARSVGWIESEIQGWLPQRVENGRPRAP